MHLVRRLLASLLAVVLFVPLGSVAQAAPAVARPTRITMETQRSGPTIGISSGARAEPATAAIRA